MGETKIGPTSSPIISLTSASPGADTVNSEGPRPASVSGKGTAITNSPRLGEPTQDILMHQPTGGDPIAGTKGATGPVRAPITDCFTAKIVDRDAGSPTGRAPTKDPATGELSS